MLLVGVIRLLRNPAWRSTLAASATVVTIGFAFVAVHGALPQLGNLNLVVFFVLIVAALVFAGVPIAFAFGRPRSAT